MKKIIEILQSSCGNERNLLMSFFLVMMILLTFIEVLARKSLIIILLPLFLATILFFLALKKIDKDKDRRFVTLSLWCLLIGAIGLTYGALYFIAKSKIMTVIGLIIMLAYIIMFAVYMLAPSYSETKEALYNYDILNPASGGRKMVDKRNPGDAQIGHDIKTHKPVIIPYQDRFVHMLVLGATGTGKTSQILTPMIRDDIDDDKMGVICLEPKGDFAEQVFAMAKLKGRDVIYFNPILKNCPYFNPLRGDENDVIENMVTTFKAFDSDSSSFFKENNEQLIRRALKVLKRLYGDKATLLDLETIVFNVGNQGTAMIKQFEKLPVKNEIDRTDNKNIVAWFMDDYYTGITGGRSGTKTYENTSGVRNLIAKLNANMYLRKVLNPPRDQDIDPENFVDFDKVLREGGIITMTSAQGKLRALSKFLGYFIILQLQSSVFRRPGTPDTRKGCSLYIDEFQTYANDDFSDMLTQGRSYRVACILATQNRALIGMNSGKNAKAFVDLVSTNARNVVLFPGANAEDASYYSKQFGEVLEVSEDVSVNRKRPNMFNIFDGGFYDERETVKVKEEYKARFRVTDIIYQDFTEVIYSVIQNNTLQYPGKSKIEFISKDLKNQIEAYLEDFKYSNEYQNDSEIHQSVAEHSDKASPQDEDDDFDFVSDGDNRSTSPKIDLNMDVDIVDEPVVDNKIDNKDFDVFDDPMGDEDEDDLI